MLKSLSLAVTLLLASPLCNADVFKCIKDGGRTVYQNFPCPIDSIGSEATQRPPAPAVAPAAPRIPVDMGRNAKTVAAPADKTTAADRQVTFRMEKDQVRAIWGDPSTIVQTGRATGLVEMWKYDGDRTVGFNSKGIVANLTPLGYQDKE